MARGLPAQVLALVSLSILTIATRVATDGQSFKSMDAPTTPSASAASSSAPNEPSAPPLLSASPRRLDFGHARMCTVSVQTLTVSLGSGAAEVLNVTALHVSDPSFYPLDFAPQLLARGSPLALRIVAVPRAAGLSTGRAVLTATRAQAPGSDARAGPLKLSVDLRVVGVDNDFRVRPLIGRRVPAGQPFSGLLSVYNPSDSATLVVREVFASEPFIKLEPMAAVGAGADNGGADNGGADYGGADGGPGPALSRAASKGAAGAKPPSATATSASAASAAAAAVSASPSTPNALLSGDDAAARSGAGAGAATQQLWHIPPHRSATIARIVVSSHSAQQLEGHVHVVTSMEDLVVPVSVSFVSVGGIAAEPPALNLDSVLDPGALLATGGRSALWRLSSLADAVSAAAPEGSPQRASAPAEQGVSGGQTLAPQHSSQQAPGTAAPGAAPKRKARKGAADAAQDTVVDASGAVSGAKGAAGAGGGTGGGSAAGSSGPASGTVREQGSAEPDDGGFFSLAEGAAPPAGSVEALLHWDIYRAFPEAHHNSWPIDGWAAKWAKAVG